MTNLNNTTSHNTNDYEELCGEDIPSILAEYDSEETTSLKRAYARLNRIDRELEEIENQRLEALEAIDAAEGEVLAVANEERWTV